MVLYKWDIPRYIVSSMEGWNMQNAVREYDAKLDTKHRITLRSVLFDYYHVSEYDDGRIVLEPRELTVPFKVSSNTLKMMDEAIHNLKDGKASDAIDLSEFTE